MLPSLNVWSSTAQRLPSALGTLGLHDVYAVHQGKSKAANRIKLAAHFTCSNIDVAPALQIQDDRGAIAHQMAATT